MNAIQFLSAQPWAERFGWALVNFLWQGTAIAALYAIVRKWIGPARDARTRYGLACAALVAMVGAPIATFSLMDGSNTAPATTLIAGVQPKPVSAQIDSRPFQSLPPAAPLVWRDDVLPWFVAAWFVGAIVCWTRMMGGWLIAARMRSMTVRAAPAEWQSSVDRLAARVRVLRPVRLLGSALVQVPTVVGWLRPVILLPIGALTGMAPAHIEVLLAHELAHIRRCDYLVNVLQSVAEALLFYHPGVWWISSHIRAERELCCDDVAIAITGDKLTYARALAELESYRPEHLAPVLAANGGVLSDRIAHLLGQSRPASGSLPGPGALVSGILILAACGLLAQSVDTRPAFEVASVKSDKSETGVSHVHTLKESLVIENVSLKRLIGIAHGVPDMRDYLFSGPEWLDSVRFDISAKFPPGTSDSDVLLMLQRLLEERFQLRLHRETREFSAYALVVGKKGPGPKLHAAAGPETGFLIQAQSGHAAGTSISMAVFADRLSRPGFQLGRQVVDFTGLTGTFDLTLDWKPDSRPDGGQTENQPESVSDASIFTALEEQLGLRLEPRKVPLDVLIVDQANKTPTEN